MSYINQDPDIIVPFKGKNVVQTTASAWMVRQAAEEGLSSLIAGAAEASAQCWCGCCPGACVDCQEADMCKPKINIGSGEDATWSV